MDIIFSGDCRIGWTFLVVIAVSALLIICACLSTRAGHPVQWGKIPTTPGQGDYSDDQTTPLKTANV